MESIGCDANDGCDASERSQYVLPPNLLSTSSRKLLSKCALFSHNFMNQTWLDLSCKTKEIVNLISESAATWSEAVTRL